MITPYLTSCRKWAGVLLAVLLVPLAVSPAFAAVESLSWDDLWPEGEKEITEQMYQSYLRDLEAQQAQENAASLPPMATQRRGPPITAIPEGSRYDEARQFGSYKAVDALDGQEIALSGYLVPLDYNADQTYSEFLLVPYFGACIHAPPPPPNQTVYVRSDRPLTVKDISKAYKVEGQIKVEKAFNDLGNAAYTLNVKKLTEVK